MGRRDPKLIKWGAFENKPRLLCLPPGTPFLFPKESSRDSAQGEGTSCKRVQSGKHRTKHWVGPSSRSGVVTTATRHPMDRDLTLSHSSDEIASWAANCIFKGSNTHF
jgi:hypothetical protein